MPSALDETHDAARRSWVPGADAHVDFPIQNLPLGIFECGDANPRAGVAIGDCIVDLAALADSGLLDGDAQRAAVASASPTLNALLTLGAEPRRSLRRRLSSFLTVGAKEQPRLAPMLRDRSTATLHLPTRIGGFTDFYAGIHHARNVGSMFRPEAPLLSNYKFVPVGYHGRTSSIRPSGTDVRRPHGQLKGIGDARPRLAPTERLDYELEVGIWIGKGNTIGDTIPIDEADEHIAGLCLLNDWSARDIQTWEYQPLGPFLAKNFASTISPWIVTAEALAPFRVSPRPRDLSDPSPLPYLFDPTDQETGAYAIELLLTIRTRSMRKEGLPSVILSKTPMQALYWTPAQLVAHHAIGGCNLEPGDLLGTGTVSDDSQTALGSMLELTKGGAEPIQLPNGEKRSFLEDGDEIAITGHAASKGWRSIGFGECRATVKAVLESTS